MFITNELHRSPIAPLFGDVSRALWFTVELTHPKAWFMVSFREFESDSHDSFSICRTLFVERAESILKFAQLNRHGPVEIELVQIITPAHMNGTNHWKIELLESVMAAKQPGAEGWTAHVFVTQDGNKYCDSMLETAIADMQLGEVLFKAPSCHDH